MLDIITYVYNQRKTVSTQFSSDYKHTLYTYIIYNKIIKNHKIKKIIQYINMNKDKHKNNIILQYKVKQTVIKNKLLQAKS